MNDQLYRLINDLAVSTKHSPHLDARIWCAIQEYTFISNTSLVYTYQTKQGRRRNRAYNDTLSYTKTIDTAMAAIPHNLLFTGLQLVSYSEGKSPVIYSYIAHLGNNTAPDIARGIYFPLSGQWHGHEPIVHSHAIATTLCLAVLNSHLRETETSPNLTQ